MTRRHPIVTPLYGIGFPTLGGFAIGGPIAAGILAVIAVGAVARLRGRH